MGSLVGNQRVDTVGIAERMRLRIQSSNMLDRLIRHVTDELEMSATQCQVALKLVGKILPDLKQVEVNATVEHKSLNIHELNGRLIALGRDPQSVWDSLDTMKPVKQLPVTIDQEPDTNDDT